jgi:hypothetical protein
VQFFIFQPVTVIADLRDRPQNPIDLPGKHTIDNALDILSFWMMQQVQQ